MILLYHEGTQLQWHEVLTLRMRDSVVDELCRWFVALPTLLATFRNYQASYDAKLL
jgi:hypothetical protein